MPVPLPTPETVDLDPPQYDEVQFIARGVVTADEAYGAEPA